MDTSPASPAIFHGSFSGLAARFARFFSPAAARARLTLEGDARIAASQILLAATQRESADASRILDDAWRTYGFEPFTTALSSPVWSCPDPDNLTVSMATPAEAISSLPCSEWIERLAPHIPAGHWAHRTQASQAFKWSVDENEDFAKRGIRIESISPLIRLCNNARIDSWSGALAAIAPHIPTPDKHEILACRVFLNKGRSAAFDAWLVSRELSAACPEHPSTPAKARPRL